MMERTWLLSIFNFLSCQGILERKIRKVLSIFDSKSFVVKGFLKQSLWAEVQVHTTQSHYLSALGKWPGASQINLQSLKVHAKTQNGRKVILPKVC